MEPWVCHVILAFEITLYFEIRLWMQYKKLKKEAEKLDQHYVRQLFAIMADLPQMTMDLVLKKLNTSAPAGEQQGTRQ